MNKSEFLESLREGLQGVAPEERVAALQYYTEYLDDAGPDREQEVLDELGSPQEVAAMIRAESGGDGWTPPAKENKEPKQGAEEGAEAQKSFAEDAFGMGPAPAAPEPPPHGYGAAPGQVPPAGGHTGANVPPPPPQGYPGQNKGDGDKKAVTIVVVVLLCLLFSPLIGSILGVLASLLATAIVLLALPFIVGISLVAAGILAIVIGAFGFSLSAPTGLVSVGIGILVFGLGLLCTYGGVMLLIKVVPAIFRGIAYLFRKIFKKDKTPPAAAGQQPFGDKNAE